MIKRLLFATALFGIVANFGSVTSARASFIRAQDLYQSCLELNEFCYGYMAGTYDSVHRTFLEKPKGFCPAADVNLRILRDNFVSYARTNPAQLNNSAADVLVKSLLQSFPCSQD